MGPITKIITSLGEPIFKCLTNSVQKKAFRRENIETRLFKRTDFEFIIERDSEILNEILTSESIKGVNFELVCNFFKFPNLEYIIREIYDQSDPLNYCDIHKIYSEFEALVSEYFKLENPRVSNFPTKLFEILIEGCNDTLSKLNNDGDIPSQKALYNYSNFIEECNKIKELYGFLRKYPKVPDYLPRVVCEAKNYNSSSFLYPKNNCETILQVIEKNKHVVLLSDAGSGKTTELKQIAYHYSRLHPSYYPIFVSLNKYTNKSISDYFPEYWELIPERELIIILDGFDEIQGKNKMDAIRELGFFVEKYPDVHVIISCRTNFYKVESENRRGLFDGFTSYILLDLENRDINKYVEDKLALKSTNFFDSISEKKIYLLLKSPFYLIKLVELFTKNNELPKSKAELFENLFESRIELDITHYRTTRELEKEKKNVMENLEYVALAMECLGRNYINNEELEEILPESSSRELLEYCTTWVKQKTERVTWQFEHNNFQEYLAARKLANYPLEVIKELVSFGPDYKNINPSWINTLSFLVSIYGADDLTNWILCVQPELFVKFEHDKINKSERIQIFQEIFENYEAKKIWINIDKFRADELARFGQSAEILDYLLNKIENAAHYTTVGNSIELLCELDITSERKERAKELLIKCTLETDYGEIVQSRALTCLSIHNWNSKEIIDQIVIQLRSSKSDRIRSGLYRLLCSSKYLDENVDVFLEGIDCSLSRQIFDSFELSLLIKGLNKTESSESLKKIISFFTEKPEKLKELYLDDKIEFLDNAVNVYSKDKSLLEFNIELFKVLNFNFGDQIVEKQLKQVLSFFDATGTRLEAFKRLYLESKEKSYSILDLGALADSDCIDFIIHEYGEKKISDDEINLFQRSLQFANRELHLVFSTRINEKYSKKFIFAQIPDYKAYRKQLLEKDIKLIFNKELFCEEIKRIFEFELKNELTTHELTLLNFHYRDQYFSSTVVNTLRNIAEDKKISLDTALEYVNNLAWDSFCAWKVYSILVREEDTILSEEQIEWISKWCYSNLSRVNFKQVVSKTESRVHTNKMALLLWYYLRKFNLSYPENVLLDMISFDSGKGFNFVGIEYLEEKLAPSKMKNRILENLKEGIEHDFILKNHIDYCAKHRIEEILQYTPSIIVNDNRSYKTRKLALDLTCDISDTISELEEILPKVGDEFKWDVFRKLLDKNSNCCQKFLITNLRTGKESDRLEAAKYLMTFQNLDGLAFFVEWVKKHNDPWSIDYSALRTLNSSKALPYLIELIKISYQEDEIQGEKIAIHYDVLEALTKIATSSETNFHQVKKCIEEFIDENLDVDGVNFLYSHLERLEFKYYMGKNEEMKVSDIITKLKRNGIY